MAQIEDERNKAIVRKMLHDGFSKGDLDVVEETVAHDLVTHRPGMANLARIGGAMLIRADGLAGLEGLKKGLVALRTAFPDYHEEVEELVCEGNRVVGRWTVTATHLGSIFGVPATGRKIRFTEVGFLSIADGKVTEFWGIADEIGIAEQLGGSVTLPQ